MRSERKVGELKFSPVGHGRDSGLYSGRNRKPREDFTQRSGI